ncbi:MAG: hypothetical protein KatS3mg105_4632 [Gemmatales bacterium]|nr:MAG: hypothetical protein KatS3mg105_4632 [Gemmatales bacterium]
MTSRAPAGFARLDHVDVEAVETFGMFAKGFAQTGAGFDVVDGRR